MPQMNAHADIFIDASSLNFCLSFHLYLYFVYIYVSSGGSGESAHMRADSPDPSLLADVISTEFLYTYPLYILVCFGYSGIS